jgi:hypothetical protein
LQLAGETRCACAVEFAGPGIAWKSRIDNSRVFAGVRASAATKLRDCLI